MKPTFVKICIFGLFLCLFYGCEEQLSYTEEFIEVYQVESASPEAAKGKLSFKESYVKDQNGRTIAHGIYNKSNTVEAVEKFIFNADQDQNPSKSEYRNTEDQLLSYYTFQYDDAGNKSNKVAFDGANDEILRIESYEYDKQNNMTKKFIKTAMDSIVKVYSYGYDEFGNETHLQISDGKGTVLLEETFVITKKRKDGKWVERYAYRNDQPVTFGKRYWQQTQFSK